MTRLGGKFFSSGRAGGIERAQRSTETPSRQYREARPARPARPETTRAARRPEATTIDNLLERIRSREACVGIIGLGYVGLPLVRAFSQAGFPVTGFDVDPQKVAVLSEGGTYIGHIPAELVGSLVAEGRFEPTTDFDRLAGCDAIVICVPTPLTPQREPDTSYIRQTAGDIQARLRRGQLVVLESTTYPGTMDDLVKPILESSGLACGTDFFLAYSPEREDPGNERYTTSVIPKVVGADDPGSLRLAEALYGAIVDKVVPVSSMRAAEATKITENIYRAVNIALVNELKVLFTQMGIDVWEVIDAAATKPFGFQPFYPGPGLGGHCLLPGERLPIRSDGSVRLTPVEDLWDRHASSSSEAGCTLVASPERLEIAALDGGTGSWNRVTALGRRPYHGDAVGISTRGGRRLRVTADHRMLVHESGALRIRRAAQLEEGDLLPVWRGHEEWGALLNPCVDLLADVTWPHTAVVALRLRHADWRPWRRELRALLGQSRTDDAMRYGHIPLRTFLELEAAGVMSVSHDDLLLCTGRGRSARVFPAVTELTPEIARLVGYYAAEGCVVDSKVVFTFHREEREAIQDAVKLLGSLGLVASVWESPRVQATQIKASSLPFARLLRDALNCGANSYDARIPDVLLGASAEHRTNLLAGLLRGDGSVWTESVELGEQVDHLMRSLGLGLRIHGAQDRRYGEIHLVPVERIDRFPYEGHVYSLETAPSHTFAASHGIVVANCIPVDPFYLTWKAREYEHTTRFIELAGEINTSMPAYVIARLVRALNDRGKAVNGARVLVLGVAYKPGVDDDRESPSYKLIDELQDLGAVVSYNDPYIPKLRPGRRYDLGLESTDLTAATIAAQDCVLVATAHAQYDWPEIVRHAQLVVDTRNATAGITEGREKVVKA